ncbi:hypothetical protein ACFZCK_14020 [Kitasatospora purpeofusca]|uniref:hypothetical protein n=1 Tax=Kitasatospora purpeofusca TaxID=67352 RepID=UPI0036F0B806
MMCTWCLDGYGQMSADCLNCGRRLLPANYAPEFDGPLYLDKKSLARLREEQSK